MLEDLFPHLIIALAWFASLFIPLFLVPEALLRLGLREVRARAFGWLSYVLLLSAILILGPFRLSAVIDMLPILVPGIAFAIFWDLRRARRAELALEP